MSEELDLSPTPEEDSPEYCHWQCLMHWLSPKRRDLEPLTMLVAAGYLANHPQWNQPDSEELLEEVVATLGRQVIKSMASSNPEHFKDFISTLTKIKKNLDRPIPREAHAWSAAGDYWKETGSPPSKVELRKYMIARREKYSDQPSPDAPWTRLWIDSGLTDFWERIASQDSKG